MHTGQTFYLHLHFLYSHISPFCKSNQSTNTLSTSQIEFCTKVTSCPLTSAQGMETALKPTPCSRSCEKSLLHVCLESFELHNLILFAEAIIFICTCPTVCPECSVIFHLGFLLLNASHLNLREFC